MVAHPLVTQALTGGSLTTSMVAHPETNKLITDYKYGGTPRH
jgi:hypothetical protein